MDWNVFTCTFCGSVCPVECFPTHKDKFICHNMVCFAHAPSNLDKLSPLRQHSTSTAPVSLLPTQTDAFESAHTRDILPASLPLEKETHEEDNEESMTVGPTQNQERKIRFLVKKLQEASIPTALDYLFDTSSVPSISEIVPGLFIGNIACIDNESVLKRYDINAVISVISPRRLPFPESQTPLGGSDPHPLEKLFTIKDRMVIVAYDRRSENLIQHFDGTCKFIYRHRHPITSATVADSDTDARSDQEKVNLPTSSTNTKEKSPKGGRVLVHCTEGISRSATIVAAYLMWRKRETAAKILTYIKHKRPKINPNEGFLHQLQVWQDVHYNIWDNKQFRVPCNEYRELQERLLNYRSQEMLKKAARRRLRVGSGASREWKTRSMPVTCKWFCEPSLPFPSVTVHCPFGNFICYIPQVSLKR